MNTKEFKNLKDMLMHAAGTDNDAETILFFRRATLLLATHGYTWEQIIDEIRENSRIVYALIRLIDDEGGKAGEPFYIGEGYPERCQRHLEIARQKKRLGTQLSHKDKAILNGFNFEILLEDLSKKDAVYLEKTLIQLILRWPNGPLFNSKRSMILFDREKISRRLQNVARAMRTSDVKAKLRRSVLEAFADPDVQKRLQEGSIKSQENVDKDLHRRNTSAGTKIAMGNPEIKQRQKDGLRSVRSHLSEVRQTLRWITNGDCSKRINKVDVLPVGWRLGRK